MLSKVQWCQNHKLLPLNVSKIVREKVSSSIIYKKVKKREKWPDGKRTATERKRIQEKAERHPGETQ